MALLTSEIQRIKYELGYNVLRVGAEPYIGVTQMFEQVIQPYTQGGATTTCATAVSAASAPTPVALTLTDATGFTVGDAIVVDVDARQERATIERLSGSAATVLLTLAHAGTYPVTVEGGETIIRELLGNCVRVGKSIAAATSRAGLKRVDEIEFQDAAAGGMSAVTKALTRELSYWRDELAGALGCANLRAIRRGGGQTIAV